MIFVAPVGHLMPIDYSCWFSLISSKRLRQHLSTKYRLWVSLIFQSLYWTYVQLSRRMLFLRDRSTRGTFSFLLPWWLKCRPSRIIRADGLFHWHLYVAGACILTVPMWSHGDGLLSHKKQVFVCISPQWVAINCRVFWALPFIFILNDDQKY